MVIEERWKSAQESEREYWRKKEILIKNERVSGLEWYNWRANELRLLLEKVGLCRNDNGQMRVLEIGCGPVGIISYIQGKERIGIDPLNSFYLTKEHLIKYRDRNVIYKTGTAEKLTFNDNSFDLVIIDNCIDHVKDLNSAMNEIHRVLDQNGILYLTVNCRNRMGYFVHRALSKCKIDKSHPYTFTKNKALDLIKISGFTLIYHETLDSWKDSFLSDLKSKNKRCIIKAVSGVSEYLVRTLAIKTNKMAENG